MPPVMRLVRIVGGGMVFSWALGCAGPAIVLPSGHLPTAGLPIDAETTARLAPAPPIPRVEVASPDDSTKVNPAIQSQLPGSAAPPIKMPKFDLNKPVAEREKVIRAAFPKLIPVSPNELARPEQSYDLAQLQQLAAEKHPALQEARAAVDAAFGAVIQAGLHPNPTVGYQADQWQPSLKPNGHSGQQGAFVSQVIVTAGKLTLAQIVAGFDYLNAIVALRRAEVDVMTNVRSVYFRLLVLRKAVESNRALSQLADEVYDIQLKQLAIGEAAGYEPLQFYAQAVLARNALIQAQTSAEAAWKQLAAAVGQPDLPPARLAGTADGVVSAIDIEAVRQHMLANHTDLLTARNAVLQAQVNIRLQQRRPIPDVQTDTYFQEDTLSRTYQFGVQIGLELPIANRNQGNIHQAQAQLAQNIKTVQSREFELLARLAEAAGRYEANRQIAANFRDAVLPNLTRSYRAILQRYQIEPERVSFNDVVVAQLNLGQAIQAYLSALELEWQAAVDVAEIGQLNELTITPISQPEKIQSASPDAP